MVRKAKSRAFRDEPGVDADERIRYPAPPKPKYVNIYLNEQDAEWLESNYAKSDTLFAEFIDSLDSTYGISLYQDKESGKWNAILSCSDEFSPNNGHKLSVRVASPFDAFFALYYVHTVKLNHIWTADNLSVRSRWG